MAQIKIKSVPWELEDEVYIEPLEGNLKTHFISFQNLTLIF